MDLEDDLIYSSEAEATRAILFQDVNDINIFVEDKNMEYIYEEIFNRLLGKEYKISAIFACGGKTKVKEFYSEFGPILGGHNNIYSRW